MNRQRFLQLVRQALDDLPSPFRESLQNVDVVVEPKPLPHHRREAGLLPGETLFGLYEGIPLTDRGSGYQMVLPDRITIFQGPLQDEFSDDDRLVDEVRRTVLHELAHYFGMDDDDLDRLGLD
jgi:predicted Zn-dependent protease with MMP-like domain